MMIDLQPVTELLKSEKRVSINFFVEKLKVDERTASRIIQLLMDAGVVGSDWDIYLGGFPVLDPAPRWTGK